MFRSLAASSCRTAWGAYQRTDSLHHVPEQAILSAAPEAELDTLLEGRHD